ncbi:MAG: hypothetical protein KGJ58_01160 [Patescibacteria group bacterium]|nr:hypothetical protein [Patescibacteria group bacterium]MDE2218050.1 hypothetical protein [Patescibacteria group bacterium]
MSKISFLFLLGILTTILPVTGFPSGWKNLFYALIGLLMCLAVLSLRKEMNSLKQSLKGREHTITDSFVQNSHIDAYGKSAKIASESSTKHIIN